jgi:DNA-binding Lrp family transcriptional regulator
MVGPVDVGGDTGSLGMSRRNVRTALESLCDEGIIERCGKRYRPAAQRPSGAFVNRVVLVAPANEHGQVISGFLEEDFLHDLEMQCAGRSLRLETRGFAAKDDGISFTTALGQPADPLSALDGVLGFIQVIFQPEQARAELFQAFFHSRRPVALFDAIGGWDVPTFMKNQVMVRVFDFSTGKHRARAVARYLLSLGHRSIAYLSPYHRLSWSQQRYDGLGEAFMDAGLPGAVSNFSMGLAGSDGQYEQAMNDHKPHLLEKSMSALIESWSRKVPHWYAEAIHEKAHSVPSAGFHEGEIARRMEECFAAAYDQKQATAWVGANDDTAILALDYCRRHAIRVPDHLSIIGFDNKVVAFKNGLSSYDFNRHGVISAMLNFLLRPGSISHLTSRQRVQIPGYVVERATTGRPG